MTQVGNILPGQPINRRARSEAVAFYLFISPWIFGFLFLTLAPMIVGILGSFTNFNGVNFSTLKLIGWANYARALKDPLMYTSLKNTVLIALILAPLVQICSLLLAIALNQPLRGRNLFRMLFYIPSILPIVAVAWIWKMMFDTNAGLVNGVLDLLSPGLMVRWMTELPMVVLVGLSIWTATGGVTLVYLAGLQNVSKELEEAALIDGANRWQSTWSVTLPLLSPIIFYQVITGLIGVLQMYLEPVLLGANTRGTINLTTIPPRPTYTIMVHVFQTALGKNLYGYGLAINWLLFFVILIVTLIVFRSSSYWVYYETEVRSKKDNG